MHLTIKEIVQAVGAKISEEFANINITGVEFDTRKISSGNLFVPLSGARDGHDFVKNAIGNGAVATFWSQPIEKAPSDIIILQVADTLVAMQKLAQYYLQKKQPKVVGITGSNGKTTTKDMTAAVLATQYKTYKTQGNYNNHIGTPYTILHMPKETEILVLEMGMDHSGEIEVLSKMAQPDIAAITMIGESHIEFFGSRQKIAEAKAEILTGLKVEGTIIVPGEEELLTPLVENIPQKVVTFGMGAKNDIQGRVLSESKEQTCFQMNQFPQKEFTIPVVGSYNVANALIAITIGAYFNVEIMNIQKGLACLNLTQNRTEWLRTKDGIEILSDVYNANPTAMALVLDAFSEIESDGKKIVVLGDMLELGEFSQEMHESMSEHIHPKAIQEVYLYGEEMNFLKIKIMEKFPEHRVHYYKKNQQDQLIVDLKGKIQPKDMIMLKGSNGMNLKTVIENIMK